MRDDDFSFRDFGSDFGQDRCDVLVRNPVEAITLDSGPAGLLWQGHQLGHPLMSAVKTGIKARDLRHAGQSIEGRLDRREVVRLMQGS